MDTTRSPIIHISVNEMASLKRQEDQSTNVAQGHSYQKRCSQHSTGQPYTLRATETDYGQEIGARNRDTFDLFIAWLHDRAEKEKALFGAGRVLPDHNLRIGTRQSHFFLR